MTTNSTSSQDDISSCQSTNLHKATSPLHIWDIRQYIWDLSSGTFSPLERMHTLLLSLKFRVQEITSGKKSVIVCGNCKKTPTATLNLQPGELVEIRTRDEILATLDSRGRNRGLEFTPEMLKYCGGRYRVLKRLNKMINEKTGIMRHIANTVILEEIFCDGKAHGGCQRTCYCFWREIWLRRVERFKCAN